MIYQSRLPENPAGGFSFMLPYRIRCARKPGSGRLCALSARRLRPAFRDRTVFRCFAAARGRTLETHIPAGIFYRGDEYAVRQLISILLDNAVKYSDAGGSISLRLDRARRGVTLQTCNACTDNKHLLLNFCRLKLKCLWCRSYLLRQYQCKECMG